jgi:leucyl-tRNA synthetase
LFEKIIRLVEDIENALEKSYAMHVYAARVMEMFNIIRDASNSTFYSLGCLQLAFKILVVSITPLSPHVGY